MMASVAQREQKEWIGISRVVIQRPSTG